MTTEERLEKLERELARIQAQEAEKAAKPAEVIRGRAFVLVDDDGRFRGELAIGPYGAMLVLADETGTVTFSVP